VAAAGLTVSVVLGKSWTMEWPLMAELTKAGRVMLASFFSESLSHDLQPALE
jgi:hypothetical protein